MKAVLAGLALLMSAGMAFADEAPVPTEDGEHTESAPAPDPEPTGCHRCVGNPDGGFSDSDYSNPDGAWTTGDGNTTYDPGHSQDWYEGTGIYSGSGNCQGTCEGGTPEALQYDQDHANDGRISGRALARANGGGHDR